MAHGVTNISGTRREGIYGKTTSATINLKDSKGNDVKPKQGEFVYMNETTQLLKDNPVSQEYDRTTPVQVVNQAYDTSGNGGRKFVRLDNGWLVCVAVNRTSSPISTIVLISKNNGVNWSQLCYVQDSSQQISSPSIVNLGGTKIGFTVSFSTNRCIFFNVDCSTQTNVNIFSSFKFVENAVQSAMGTTSLAIDSNGHLHATWSSKNSTYPNSFNIRYSKSTDDGVTWASPTQITSINISAINYVNPTIGINSLGYPFVVFEEIQSGFNRIRTQVFNGSNWGGLITVYDGGDYAQSNPSATVDSNGVIHVAWNGMDSSNGHNIRYSKSNDNGQTWSAPEKLTNLPQGQLSPSISTDLNNNVFISYHGYDNDLYNVRIINNIGGVWSAPETLETTRNLMDTSMVDNYKKFEKPLLIWRNQQTPSVKFFGKWTETNDTQIIPSVNDATSESELQTIDSGTLQSYGSTQKHYVGFKTNKAIGFTPF